MSFYKKKLSRHIKDLLKNKFKDRVSFDKVECLLYSHDLGTLPPLIKPLISYRPAQAIVRPVAEAEVAYLICLAYEYNIPLTPRGRGTSGYGGAIPRYGGLVIDFTKMDKIFDVDVEKQSVSVQPGVIWWDLQQKLSDMGLSLRLYPGSAPSSTVGGALAQGGSGYGSYQYGWFSENLISVTVLQPDNKKVIYQADRLNLVADAEGITGFITEVVFKVKKAEAMQVTAVLFDNIGQLAAMLKDIVEYRLSLWSVSFLNPFMLKLRSDYTKIHLSACHFEQSEESQTDKKQQDSSFHLVSFRMTAVFVYEKSAGIKNTLDNLACRHKGCILDDKSAYRLWEERFDILKIKKLAPSLIPTKAVLPLENLEALIKESKNIKPPLAIEAVLLQDRQKNVKVVILAFMLHDERKLSYNVVYSQGLNFIKLAGKFGGRACAAGIYFKNQRTFILSKKRLSDLIYEKRRIDPRSILNPGKIICRDLFDLLMYIAWRFDFVTGFWAGKLAVGCSPLIPLACHSEAKSLRISPHTKTARFFTEFILEQNEGLRFVKNDSYLAWYAYSCDQCGFCLKDCTVFKGWESYSQKGRWYMLRLVLQGKIKLSDVQDRLLACNNCDECRIYCPQGLPKITHEVLSYLS